ncbi:HlyD family secretion protein [Methylococcus mesophilus]|uniref:hypothetical protein n=1 Tax=Methylococcus mesophilus TaxID=2993564 RepID=UPI00224A7ABF|nr:hypothetical protein [Methylococcus mesophilus]UZR30742.1 hypothetical protein OOT43_08980 [Methylococcus mesophilus]
MATGRSVNLRVRPYQSVDLSFPVDGVISKQSDTILLGRPVLGIDVEHLYAMLGEMRNVGLQVHGGRLKWDSRQISEYLSNVAGVAAGQNGTTLLGKLRNATEAADLDRALMMRQNAYLTSYSPEVLAEVRRVYCGEPRDDSLARYRLLQKVEEDITTMHNGLAGAYNHRGWSGKVIEYTRSENTNKATQYSGSGHIQFEGLTDTNSWGYEFRYPSAENDLRYHQARAGIRQEILNAQRMAEMCRHGDVTFPNEIGAIDLSIRKLQAAYIDTFLFAPFNGIVTGVFRGPGDYVRAGEPVCRVENYLLAYLVGTVKYRGMLGIGTKVDVSTTLFEAAGTTPVKVSGEIVAVRGHDAVSEQWDVLIFCENYTATGDPVLPLNYNFDFESTTVGVLP